VSIVFDPDASRSIARSVEKKKKNNGVSTSKRGDSNWHAHSIRRSVPTHQDRTQTLRNNQPLLPGASLHFGPLRQPVFQSAHRALKPGRIVGHPSITEYGSIHPSRDDTQPAFRPLWDQAMCAICRHDRATSHHTRAAGSRCGTAALTPRAWFSGGRPRADRVIARRFDT